MPTTFEKVFSHVRPFADSRSFIEIETDLEDLGEGRYPVTVFDWTKLDDDSAGMLVESHLLTLASAMGSGWSSKAAPFAMIGGESHPVPIDELDQQCEGVLLFDLRKGDGDDCPVLFCSGGGMSSPVPFAGSVKDLHLVNG